MFKKAVPYYRVSTQKRGKSGLMASSSRSRPARALQGAQRAGDRHGARQVDCSLCPECDCSSRGLKGADQLAVVPIAPERRASTAAST
jgi:hypothetical protein